MARDQLFSQLRRPEIMRIGWHLAQGDSRDDFVRDPVSYADYSFNLSERLQYLIDQIQSQRYRPRHLIEVDVPKSGLSVRPGNVLPIEEASILHAAIYLLAPKLDGKLSSSVYSYRLHADWEKKAKKGQSLFKEVEPEIPFLKQETIKMISLFESWYERWPAFEEDAKKKYLSGGYTHLTKTDIFSFFEHIDLRLLHDLLRTLLKTEEEKLLQLIFAILSGWTRPSNAGMPVNRGIPQGNDVSSFLGNLFLVPLDRALDRFCKKRDGCWFRYVDDVKVYTRSEVHAREVVFEINKVLREMHLNLQGSKTEILTGEQLKDEHDNTKLDAVNAAFNNVLKLRQKQNSNKEVTSQLNSISLYLKPFTQGNPQSVRGLKGRDNRLFRRLLATYGAAGRTRKGLNETVFAAIQELPDLRVLRSCLGYLGKQDTKNHDRIVQTLLGLLDSGSLLFPFQVASVLESLVNLHPSDPSKVASQVRSLALGSNLTKQSDWLVILKALQVLSVFPYREKYVTKISVHYVEHPHPMVRRAAVLLLPRAPKKDVRKYLHEFSHHPDSGVARLAQYLLLLSSDSNYAPQELARLRKSNANDNALVRRLYQLYAASATESPEIAKEVLQAVEICSASKSVRLCWHRSEIMKRASWVTDGPDEES